MVIDYDKVADIYDALVTTGLDVPFFLEECRKAPGPVLELMAGTGRVSLPLLRAGIGLCCVDYSREMLAVLDNKLNAADLQAEHLCQNVCVLDLPRLYPLAFMPFHSFAELLTRQEHEQALASICRYIEPGGLFICTLHNPAIRARAIQAQPTIVHRLTIDKPEGEMEFRGRYVYDPESGIVEGQQDYLLFDTRGLQTDERSVSVRFVLFDHTYFRPLVENAGFTVETVYGDYDRRPFDPQTSPYMLWMLRKAR